MTLGDFCIRWLDRELGPCVLCGGETGSGPVGWHQGNPIGIVCDECLFHADRGLGAAIRTLNVLRELALDPASEPKTYAQTACRLMTWAHLYHRTEPWPVRPTTILDKLRQGAPGPDLLCIVEPNGGGGKAH